MPHGGNRIEIMDSIHESAHDLHEIDDGAQKAWNSLGGLDLVLKRHEITVEDLMAILSYARLLFGDCVGSPAFVSFKERYPEAFVNKPQSV